MCVLNETERLDELMEALTGMGIRGATVPESQGTRRVLAHDTPVFAGFRHLVAGDRPFNSTIFSVIENDQLCQQALGAIQKHLLPGTLEGSQGIAFTVPVSRFVRFTSGAG